MKYKDQRTSTLNPQPFCSKICLHLSPICVHYIGVHFIKDTLENNKQQQQQNGDFPNNGP